jgi:anaerobic magnesium-protoporphyrin IX monomethyl ester cyclase
MITPDLVLINPSSRKRVYQSLAAELAAIEPPVWTGLMATYAARKGCRVEVIDAEAEELSAEETAARAVDLKPALVAVVAYGHQPSASTQVMPAAGAVCAAIKQLAPQQKVLMVGGHVAALPERTLREEAADYVGGGEGLVTIVELTRALKAKEADLSKVADLYYRSGDEVVPPVLRAPLVNDLDHEMPGIAWEMLPMHLYRAHNWHCLGNIDGAGDLDRSPYASIYTSLGCPYKCTFCCIQAPFKSGEAELGMRASTNSYRFWSPQRVGDELEYLVKNFGIRNVKFADEMFVLNKRHVEGICDEIIRRGLDLNIWAYARVDTVKEGMLPKLKQAGFNWLGFGIEAANTKVRDDVQKGFDQDDIFETINKVWNHDIFVISNYIFGLPEDNYDTMQETLDLAMRLNCEFANFYSAMAYPGSPLYHTAFANHWKLPETWAGYSQHAVDTLPLPTNYLSGSEVLRFRDKAFQTYYKNPDYLSMVERKFGVETVEHLRAMTTKTLERQYA